MKQHFGSILCLIITLPIIVITVERPRTKIKTIKVTWNCTISNLVSQVSVTYSVASSTGMTLQTQSFKTLSKEVVSKYLMVKIMNRKLSYPRSRCRVLSLLRITMNRCSIIMLLFNLHKDSNNNKSNSKIQRSIMSLLLLALLIKVGIIWQVPLHSQVYQLNLQIKHQEKVPSHPQVLIHCTRVSPQTKTLKIILKITQVLTKAEIRALIINRRTK